MKENIVYFIVGIIYLAILYTLVKPQSNGPTIIENLFSAFTSLVRGVAGETYNSSTGTWSSSNG